MHYVAVSVGCFCANSLKIPKVFAFSLYYLNSLPLKSIAHLGESRSIHWICDIAFCIKFRIHCTTVRFPCQRFRVLRIPEPRHIRPSELRADSGFLRQFPVVLVQLCDLPLAVLPQRRVAGRIRQDRVGSAAIGLPRIPRPSIKNDSASVCPRDRFGISF